MDVFTTPSNKTGNLPTNQHVFRPWTDFHLVAAKAAAAAGQAYRSRSCQRRPCLCPRCLSSTPIGERVAGFTPVEIPRILAELIKKSPRDYHSALSTQPQSLPETPLPSFIYPHSNVCEPDVLIV